MDEWIDDRISTIILPHMLNFLLDMKVLAQQNVKKSDPKLTDVIFYLLDWLALHANMPLIYPLGMLLGHIKNKL